MPHGYPLSRGRGRSSFAFFLFNCRVLSAPAPQPTSEPAIPLPSNNPKYWAINSPDPPLGHLCDHAPSRTPIRRPAKAYRMDNDFI